MRPCLRKLSFRGVIPLEPVSRCRKLVDDERLKRRDRHATTIAVIAMCGTLNRRCGSTLTRVAVLVLGNRTGHCPRHEHRYTDGDPASAKSGTIPKSTSLNEYINRLTVQHRTT